MAKDLSLVLFFISIFLLPLSGYCRGYYYDDNYSNADQYYTHSYKHHHHTHYGSRRSYGSMPSKISSTGEKVIIVNPNIHKFGAYSADGTLLRSGTATAGSNWCPDIHRPCRTRAGTFRIFSLGSSGCRSTRYPVGRGGAPMPYCMYFNKNQALHGSHEVVNGNISHGCVRLHVDDAAWIRFNFAHVGTKVVIQSY